MTYSREHNLMLIGTLIGMGYSLDEIRRILKLSKSSKLLKRTRAFMSEAGPGCLRLAVETSK